jgi:hypothetical protein
MTFVDFEKKLYLDSSRKTSFCPTRKLLIPNTNQNQHWNVKKLESWRQRHRSLGLVSPWKDLRADVTMTGFEIWRQLRPENCWSLIQIKINIDINRFFVNVYTCTKGYIHDSKLENLCICQNKIVKLRSSKWIRKLTSTWNDLRADVNVKWFESWCQREAFESWRQRELKFSVILLTFIDSKISNCFSVFSEMYSNCGRSNSWWK